MSEMTLRSAGALRVANAALLLTYATAAQIDTVQPSQPYKAQIPLRRLSPKLPRGESRGHKPSRHLKICEKNATNPFVSL